MTRHLRVLPDIPSAPLTVADLPAMPNVSVVADVAGFCGAPWLVDSGTIYLPADLSPSAARVALAEAVAEHFAPRPAALRLTRAPG